MVGFKKFLVGMSLLCFTCPIFAAPQSSERWWIVVQHDINGNTQIGESSSIEWRSDGRTYFWVHMFYAYPKDGLKSALIQYSVHCSERNITEHLYIDFDANREEIGRGDNTGYDNITPVRSGTTTEFLVNFACSSDVNRTTKFMSISTDASVWEVGEFFSDPRPLIKQ